MVMSEKREKKEYDKQMGAKDEVWNATYNMKYYSLYTNSFFWIEPLHCTLEV